MKPVFVTDFVEIWVLELPRDCVIFVTHLSHKSIGYRLSFIVYRLSSTVCVLAHVVYISMSLRTSLLQSIYHSFHFVYMPFTI